MHRKAGLYDNRLSDLAILNVEIFRGVNWKAD